MNNEKFRDFIKNDPSLSYRKVSAMVGTGILSKSSVEQLTKPKGGGLTQTYIKSVLPYLMEVFAIHLRKQGSSETEIHKIIFEIFEKEYKPMITKRQTLEKEVVNFFGLERDPFALESDPRNPTEFFINQSLDKISKRIENAVHFEGLLAVIGEIGAGKTSLQNYTVSRLKKQGKMHIIFPKFVHVEKLTAAGIIHYLLEYFGLHPRHRLVIAQRQLEKQLEYLNEQGDKISIWIQESHHLPDETITALKNFYELGTGGYERFLSLVLFGQPKFKKRLNDIQFREIAERMDVIEMPSFSKTVPEYIAHRLKLAGGDVNKLFEKAAINIIAKQAGTPLAIGNLANKGLIKCYEQGESRVLARYIQKDKEPKTRKVGNGR